MLRRTLNIFAMLFLAIGLMTSGCGKKKKGTNAVARLAFENGTSLRLSGSTDCLDLGPDGFHGDECWTPTKLGLKILNVYVSPDEQGATSAPAGLVWVNEACPVTSSSSEIKEKTYDYDTAGDCTDENVSSFFDLARSTEEVNAELNSQDRRILPGTYNYVQIGFCIGGAKTKNAQFQADGMTEPYEVQTGTCGISSVKADPAIVVGEGEAVTVSLTYDLTKTIYRKDGFDNPDSCFVSEDKATVRCFSYPVGLKPSFAKR